jgi:hypothetical protein
MARRVKRTTAATVALALLVGSACGSGSDKDEASAPPPPPPPTSALVPTTLAPADCVIRTVLAGGVTFDDAQARCDFQRLLDDLVRTEELRISVANGFNRALGSTMTGDTVADWVTYACANGGQAISELVTKLGVTDVQRLSLMTPLLDFSTAVVGECPEQEASIVSSAWAEIMPVRDQTSVEALLAETQKNQEIAFSIQEAVKGAHNLCDVVGNAGVQLIESFTSTQFNDLGDWLLGAAIGWVCGRFE